MSEVCGDKAMTRPSLGEILAGVVMDIKAGEKKIDSNGNLVVHTEPIRCALEKALMLTIEAMDRNGIR